MFWYTYDKTPSVRPKQRQLQRLVTWLTFGLMELQKIRVEKLSYDWEASPCSAVEINTAATVESGSGQRFIYRPLQVAGAS